MAAFVDRWRELANVARFVLLHVAALSVFFGAVRVGSHVVAGRQRPRSHVRRDRGLPPLFQSPLYKLGRVEQALMDRNAPDVLEAPGAESWTLGDYLHDRQYGGLRNGGLVCEGFANPRGTGCRASAFT